MDFVSNTVGTKAQNFVDLGLPDVNALDELNAFGTPATIIRRPMYGSHWCVPDHVFVEATVVGISTTRSELDYSYKNDFKIGVKIRTLGAKIFQ